MRRESWLMYVLYNASIITLVTVYIYPAWYIWDDRSLWFRLTSLRHLALLILRRPMLLPYFVWRLKYCVICIALFVRSWRMQLAAEILKLYYIHRLWAIFNVLNLILITYIYIYMYGQPPNHRCTLVKPCRFRTPTLVGCCNCMKLRFQVCDM